MLILATTWRHRRQLCLHSLSPQVCARPTLFLAESCHALGSTQTMVLCLSYVPYLSYAPAEALQENHSRSPCCLLTHRTVLGCSSQGCAADGRCRGSCTERPWHTEQDFLLSLSHTRPCQLLHLKYVHASPGQHVSHHASQTALAKKHTS